jgi:hypothetical protein
LKRVPAFIQNKDFTRSAKAGYTAGSLAGLGTLGYGGYRGGKALLHKMTADDE